MESGHPVKPMTADTLCCSIKGTSPESRFRVSYLLVIRSEAAKHDLIKIS